MALAFRRAAQDADERAKGYYSHFKDYCGIDAEKPIEFDWDSAKAIEGSSKHNANDEELPKCVTIAKYIAGNPNYLTFVARGPTSKAEDRKELAWALLKKHVQKVVIHFDDKNTTKKGECTWTCEVKDGALHATMHWNFDQYMGRANWEDVSNWLEDYLDDKEALLFELEKKKLVDDIASGKNYKYFASDGTKWLSEELGKKVEVELNWDEIRQVTGKSIHYSNKPPVSNNYLLVYFMNDGRGMYVIRSIISPIVADKMGKEAFTDAFEKVRVECKAATAHSASVRKDGKTLVVTLNVKMDDFQNFSRAITTKELAKQVENLL